MESLTPHELSLTAMVVAADPVVKIVMAILALVSIACWTIVFEKMVRLARVTREVRRIEAAARADAAIAGPDRPDGLSGRILAAGIAEWRDQGEIGEKRGERRERIERAMRAVMAAELRRVEPGLPFLATVGSAAPFVGLFGTVWGIMNSFSSIASRQDTSLAVVAPGIAEALFATALGLVAAIPAVVAYNKLATRLARLAQRLNAAIGELGNQMARTPARAARTSAQGQGAGTGA
jgi:TolQ protein